MKKVLLLICCLFSLQLSAFELKVSKMNKTDLPLKWNLETNIEEKVTLDCQSFIQGILFGQFGEDAIMLNVWECDELKEGMKKSLGKRKQHCLVIDTDRNLIESHQTCL